MVAKTETVVIEKLSNREFFERFAAPGRIGLVGGPQPIDAAIRIAQKKQRLDLSRSYYSHAFFCEGMRVDGWHWVLESDIDFAPERVQIGVQENRIDKYANEKDYPHVAILDFRIDYEEAKRMTARGLELLAKRTRYSLRDVGSMWLGLHHPQFRGRSQGKRDEQRALVCSAFVQHLCRSVGIDLAPDISTKLTTPEDISQTSVAHVRYVRFADEIPFLPDPIEKLRKKVARRLK